MSTIKSDADVLVGDAMVLFLTNDTIVGEFLRKVSKTVWRADFWLPSGISWQDLQSTQDLHFPEFRDVWIYPLLFGLVFLLIQHLLVEPLVLGPLARAAGIRNWRPPPPQPNASLEVLFCKHGRKVPEVVLLEALRASNLSVRQAEKWLRTRYIATRQNKYNLFLNSGVIAITHIVFFISGWLIMYSKPWVWNITLCWEDYPYHNVDDDVWWYYMTVLSYFWAVSVSEIVHPRRKTDGKLKIIVHHVTTVMLMTFSWICNFTRIGTVVLLVHECADIPLLLAKMCVYARRQRAANVLYAVFMVLWLVTRCVIYPFWVMRSVFFEATTYMFMPSAYIFFALLTAVGLLNLMWTVLILRTVIRIIRKKGPLKEERSTTEIEDNEEVKKEE
ncbi:ceramide synthase 6 [Procambarus clarkii]|uniref:ceramide synthase 6 n=1 Tax=Procambarus clarkii TaxID=6728 RepID=UPI001E6756B9|nr:ceramide synthase 6-like [Procambarus clarkii]